MSETREELKRRIFRKIDKVFENHLDNVEISDTEEENLYCKKAFIDDDAPDGECPEPQEMASFDHCPTRTLTIEISYVPEDGEEEASEEP